MLLPDSRSSHVSYKHTHFISQDKALFPRHVPLNLELERLRRRTGVGNGHGQNIITQHMRDSVQRMETILPR